MKIICVGRNYLDHIHELGNDIPKKPLIFIKPSSALARKDKPINFPDFTDDLEYECEVVIQICKNGKQITEQDASQYYNKWTLGIDFTARDIQNQLKKAGHPWELAKAFDNAAVIGDLLDITSSTNIQEASFQLLLNDEKVQDGNTKNMIFKIDYLVSYISKFFTLQIGDLIFTGTPAGVGSILPYDELKGFLNKKKVLDISMK
jgi:acylpyruvate hydrolase